MIEFKEETHQYIVNGEPKPSQSEIIRYFFRDEYMPPQHIMDYAAEKGKAIHKAIELYEKDDLGDLPKWIEPYLEQWKLFRKEFRNNEPIILQEELLYSEKYDFCGRVDMLFKSGLLLDVKSGQKSTKHRLQTMMYSLLVENNKIFYEPQRACLYLKEDTYKLEYHEGLEDIELCESMIKIFHWAKKSKLIK